MAIWPNQVCSTIPSGEHLRNQPQIYAGPGQKHTCMSFPQRGSWEARAPSDAPNMFGSTFHDGALVDQRVRVIPIMISVHLSVINLTRIARSSNLGTARSRNADRRTRGPTEKPQYGHRDSWDQSHAIWEICAATAVSAPWGPRCYPPPDEVLMPFQRTPQTLPQGMTRSWKMQNHLTLHVHLPPAHRFCREVTNQRTLGRKENLEDELQETTSIT